MNAKWLGVAVVLVLVAGIVVYKQAGGPELSPSVKTGDDGAVRVILFADPREADEAGGCGDIFKLVRALGGEGVPTLEVDPRAGSELIQSHRVVVEPTVIVLDEGGNETGRFEGEDSRTIAAIGSALEELKPAR